MRRNTTGLFAALAAAAALAALGATGASASGTQGQAPQAPGLAGGESHANVIPGTRLWVSRYNGTAHRNDLPSSVAVSPDGKTMFVTGSSEGVSSQDDYATVAYRTTTGARLWVKRYGKSGRLGSGANAVTVSPGGGMVFVTGLGGGPADRGDYATVAYRAATGAQLWVRRYNGPANAYDEATSVAASPTGGTVFVAGRSTGTTTAQDYATVAYRATTGAQLWVRRYNGPANSIDSAESVTVSPDGAQVFVTGTSSQHAAQDSFTTIAYGSATGGRLWASSYQGPSGESVANSVAVSPSGKKVFVAGSSDGGTTGDDFATLAYDSATGTQLWADRYDGPGNLGDDASALAVSPHGGWCS